MKVEKLKFFSIDHLIIIFVSFLIGSQWDGVIQNQAIVGLFFYCATIINKHVMYIAGMLEEKK